MSKSELEKIELTDEMENELRIIVKKSLKGEVYVLKNSDLGVVSEEDFLQAILNYYDTPEKINALIDENLDFFEQIYLRIKENSSTITIKECQLYIEYFLYIFEPNNIRENNKTTSSLLFKVVFGFFFIILSIIAFFIDLTFKAGGSGRINGKDKDNR